MKSDFRLIIKYLYDYTLIIVKSQNKDYLIVSIRLDLYQVKVRYIKKSQQRADFSFFNKL